MRVLRLLFFSVLTPAFPFPRTHPHLQEDAYKSTTCTIHTFDCTIETGNMPAHIRDRVTFHKICMGSSENNSEGKVFMNLKEIMDMLGHSYVTLLKVREGGREGRRARRSTRRVACPPARLIF